MRLRAGLEGRVLGMSGWGMWLSLENNESSLSAREERRWDTKPPAGARVRVQLSHTKSWPVEGMRNGKEAAFVADGEKG